LDDPLFREVWGGLSIAYLYSEGMYVGKPLYLHSLPSMQLLWSLLELDYLSSSCKQLCTSIAQEPASVIWQESRKFSQVSFDKERRGKLNLGLSSIQSIPLWCPCWSQTFLTLLSFLEKKWANDLIFVNNKQLGLIALNAFIITCVVMFSSIFFVIPLICQVKIENQLDKESIFWSCDIHLHDDT